jgi:hypothetical protein
MGLHQRTRSAPRSRRAVRRPKRPSILEADRQDIVIAKKAIKEPGPNIPWEQVKAELGL